VNKSRATRLLIGRWENSKDFFYFLHCFSTDQSEAESRYGVIIVVFEAITEVEMHLHGPAKKPNRKTHLNKN
jgi:hypothetical protein